MRFRTRSFLARFRRSPPEGHPFRLQTSGLQSAVWGVDRAASCPLASVGPTGCFFLSVRSLAGRGVNSCAQGAWEANKQQCFVTLGLHAKPCRNGFPGFQGCTRTRPSPRRALMNGQIGSGSKIRRVFLASRSTGRQRSISGGTIFACLRITSAFQFLDEN